MGNALCTLETPHSPRFFQDEKLIPGVGLLYETNGDTRPLA